MIKTKKRYLKIALSMVLVLTLAFPAMTGMAVAEAKANQLYMTVDDSNTAYESIGRLPGNVVSNIKMYYSNGGTLTFIEDNKGFDFPRKAGTFAYKGAGIWEWNNKNVTPGIYEIKYTKGYTVYSMRLRVFCDPSELNLKWNADKTEATFTRVAGVDYYVAQISVDGKEISRKGISGTTIPVSKEDVAAACDKSAKTAKVEVVLTPFGRDADCQAFIRGNDSYPLCQRTIEASFKVSELIPKEVKEEVKQEPVKEEVKQEPVKEEVKQEPVKEEVKPEPVKEEVKQEPVKEEVKQEPVKEEVKQDTVKEETKQEVKEEPKKEESKEPVKTAKQSTIDGVQNTTIKVNTTFIMNLYGGDKIKVTWTKSPGYKVDYYQVYRSMSKNKGFKKAFTTKNGKTTTYTNTGGIVKFETYYYKVRGVREINGQKYYTKWSNVKKQIFA